MSHSLRNAAASDAEAVSALLKQLGYDVDAEAARVRLAALSRAPDADVVVAAAAKGAVAGVISSHAIPLLAEGGCFVRITALAVADGHRQRGLGRLLVSEIERRARLRGASLVEVSSGHRPERAPAHAFYAALGFADARADSAVYRKPT